MRRRFYQRWCATLGMLAMLGTLVAGPLTVTQAFAAANMAISASAEKATTAQAMPCHKAMQAAKTKSTKHCPNCPQKVCPDMGTCLVKIFQPLPMPVAQFEWQRPVTSADALPAPSSIFAGSLIPPLLRPPSI